MHTCSFILRCVCFKLSSILERFSYVHILNRSNAFSTSSAMGFVLMYAARSTRLSHRQPSKLKRSLFTLHVCALLLLANIVNFSGDTNWSLLKHQMLKLLFSFHFYFVSSCCSTFNFNDQHSSFNVHALVLALCVVRILYFVITCGIFMAYNL